MLAYTQMRGQVLSSTVPAHRMCQTLLIVFAFMDAGMHPDAGSSALKYRACAQNVSDVTHSFQISGCRPAPRSRVKWSQVRHLRTECVRHYSSFLQFGMLAYTQMRGQVLSSTVPAHRMSQTSLTAFTFWDAGLHPDEGPSALKYRACVQNVADVTHSFYILGCWPTPR
jgi:hypothetical protein